MIEFKPCPFCGNENILLFDKNKFYYKCPNCQFESRECDTKEEAAQMWNLQTAICNQEIYINESGGRTWTQLNT